MADRTIYPIDKFTGLPRFVDVTQAHIENGKQRDGKLCPIGIAMTEAGFSSPEVGDFICYVVDSLFKSFPDLVSLECQSELGEWWVDYDDGLEVHPITIELDSGRRIARILD
jgi:hypothetical protein